MSQHTNNPFAAQTSQGAVEATANRFPSLESPPIQQQAYGQQQPPQFIQPQYTSFQQPPPPQQQPSYTGYPQPQAGGVSGFQPQSYTGQQIQSQVTGIQQFQAAYGGGSPFQHGPAAGGPFGGGMSTAQAHGGQQFNGQGGYGGQAPQQSFVSDLDPYGNLGVLQNTSGPQRAPPAAGPTSQPEAHPRTFVQSHKAQLTQWDDYTWKQLLNRTDGLREAWEARKQAVVAATGKGGDDYVVDALRKQAESNIDSIHASRLQLSEVQAGWRHSTDPASKARVREALNSGLTSLPDFPTALAPEQLGGIFAQRATEDYRKQSILQAFNTPQQQGLAPLYAQPTGFPGASGGAGYVPQQTGYPQQQQQQGFLGPQQTGFYGGGYQQGPGGQYYG